MSQVAENLTAFLSVDSKGGLTTEAIPSQVSGEFAVKA
jgi:hypothetical protein